ncbi:hypothetical protein G6O67_002704 [Ophiocordyceps sinensis]|uniref:Uncharacterized protein n=1 Tax=Ophiocordyceps sinensis TaxID=72228 RepID=A0A8H4V7V0_9HYPO|nr:hypothetical protein G6O67_002704 [Ophiocordyceps sinensis]
MLADENWSVVQSVQPTGAAIGPVYFNHTAYQTTSISKFFEEASIVVSRDMDKVQLSFWVFHDMALGATLTGGICWYAQVFFDTRAAIRRELIDENKTDLKSSMKVDGNDKTTGTQCRAVAVTGEPAARALAEYLAVHGSNPSAEGARDPHFARLARAAIATPCRFFLRYIRRNRILNLDETPIPFEYLDGYTYEERGTRTIAGKSDRSLCHRND